MAGLLDLLPSYDQVVSGLQSARDTFAPSPDLRSTMSTAMMLLPPGIRGGMPMESMPMLRPANSNMQTAGVGLRQMTKDEISQLQPLSLKDRIWQNYASRMHPDEVMGSESVWGNAPRLASEKGISESEAFAELANDIWSRQAANRYITPDLAKSYMRMERGRMNGIGAVPDMRGLLGLTTQKPIP